MLVAPVGSDFNWSPKDTSLEKTASTETAQKSDKDLLYEAAKKVVKAQFMELDKPVDMPCGDEMPCGGDVAPDSIEEVVEEVVPDGAPNAEDVATEGSGDVQEAVRELVEKAEAAEEVAEAVGEAVEKVEEAVQEVKSVIGGGDEEILDEVEIEIGDDEVKDDEVKDDGDEEKKDEDNEDDIIQESKDKDVEASQKVLEMKSAASGDELAKFASLSPSVKKKIYDYWKNDLNYAPDYCKLLITDS